MARELKAIELRRTFDPATLGMESTEDLPPLTGIIGQERAVSALQFGLGIEAAGFNIYVSGPPGIGKMTAVQAFLEERAQRRNTPSDWVYVNNFDDPSQPRALPLPPGRGRELQEDIHGLIGHVRRAIPQAFESDEYQSKREAIVNDIESQGARVLETLRLVAEKAGFSLQSTPLGVAIIPIHDGQPLLEADFNALPAPDRERLQRKRDALNGELKAAMKPVRDLERAAQERFRQLDREVALFIVGEPIQELVHKYRDVPEVAGYPEEVQRDILDNLDAFKGAQGKREATGALPFAPPGLSPDLFFRRYRVNVLVDNGKRRGAPVVVELNPSHSRLFGRIEKEAAFGFTHTDFTLIKSGVIHLANGGYLVLPIEDVLRSPLAWEGLKRALRGSQAEIENIADRIELTATRSLRPQPIPLDVKVVLVGRPWLYYLLDAHDEEFRQLFKVRADFDTSMAMEAGNVSDLLSFAGTLCRKENLLAMDAGALAALLEHAARLAEDQRKLSTHFGAIADVIREAHYWATQSEAKLITAEHLQRALEEKAYRGNLLQEHIQNLLERGMLLIDVAGVEVGQVNGLSVIGLGDYAFGRPSRITASVGPGMEGILDIEREVQLAGPIHSKGVLLLGGYLLRQYGRDFPLTMTARLSFEQSYSEVEGDSASAAELFAILSALSELPLRQGVAVTGSINQAGEVQAIGGVNEKIEGFFEVCRIRGLTQDQGVIVPESNIENLMLREEVVKAVQRGQFHIWAIRSVDEAMEILTGVPAGRRDDEGGFPDDSLHGRVEERLLRFTQTLHRLSEPEPAEQHPKLALP